MRWRRCLTILSLLFLLLVPTGIHAESMDGAIGNGNSPGETTAEKNDKEKADTNTSDFLSDAILSLDKDTRKKEMDRDYIKNLYNSSMTAKTKGLNLLDGDSIVTCFMNLITLLLEMIGFVITFFVLTIYNLVSSSFLGTVIQGIFDMIDKVVFDWSDPDSWINKVLLIAALSSILYKLIKDFTRIVRWQQIVQIVLTAFLSMTFITFIGQNGRKIANGFEEVTTQMLTETFVFGEKKEDPEIMNKQNIFDILQKQPFMVRHFGTTDLAKIAGLDDKDAIEKVEKRVQRLLNDPSQDNAEDEYDKFGNHAITHDGGSAMRVLGLSFVLLVHRGAISIVIAAICIGLGAVKAAKYIVLGLSVYQLIWWLLKHGRKARQWFTDRLLWCMVTIFADILFSMALFFLVELCTKISAYSVLLMLAVDVILIVLLRFVIKNLPTIMSKLMEDGKIVAEGMLLGSSPMSTYRQLKGSASQSDAFDGGGEGNGSGTGGYGESDDRDLRDHDDPYDSNYDDDALRDEKDPDMYSDDIQDDVDSADHEEAPADGASESAGQAGPDTSSEGAPTEAESETEGSDEMASETQEDIDGGAQETDSGDDGEPFDEGHAADIQNMSAETQEEEDLSDEADMSEEDMSDIDMDDDDDLIEDAGAPDISDVEGVPETVDPETEDDLKDCSDDDPIPTEAANHTDPEGTAEETSSASIEDSTEVEMITEPTQATQQPDDPNSVPAGTDVVEGGQEIGPINEQDVPAEHEASTKPEEDTLPQEEENLLNEDD